MSSVSTGPGGRLDLDNVFTYHPPTPGQVGRYEAIRQAGKAFAEEVADSCPPSPERSTALAKIREAVMWANAAIACNEPGPPPKAAADERPHSRACGLMCNGHGPQCSPDCPTCHGKAEQ